MWSLVHRLLLLAFAVLMVVSCDQVSGPSALDVAERQSEYEALAEEIDQRWLSEREIARREQDHGLLVPKACEETLSKAIARDETVANALFLASLDEDGGLREVHELLGERIELLRELDRDMQQSCP